MEVILRITQKRHCIWSNGRGIAMSIIPGSLEVTLPMYLRSSDNGAKPKKLEKTNKRLTKKHGMQVG